MFPSAAVWPQFSTEGFNLIVTVSQKRSALLSTAGLLVNPWRRWLPASPHYYFVLNTA